MTRKKQDTENAIKWWNTLSKSARVDCWNRVMAEPLSSAPTKDELRILHLHILFEKYLNN